MNDRDSLPLPEDVLLAGAGQLPAVTFTMPRADEALRQWMLAFIATIAAAPDRYRILADRINELTRLARAFEEAMLALDSPARRSPAATARKNAAREAARAAFRLAVDAVRHDASIALDDKFTLGFKPAQPRTGRAPIEPPTTAPILSIGKIGDGTHTLRFADESTPTKRRKPRGAAALQLLIIIDSQIRAVPDEVAGVIRRATRSPFTIDFREFAPAPGSPPPDAGLTVTYFARWMTATNKPGPWSLPVAATVAYAMRPGSGQP